MYSWGILAGRKKHVKATFSCRSTARSAINFGYWKAAPRGAVLPDTYLLRLAMATFLPWFDLASGKLDRGLACWGCRRAVDDNIFMDGYHERRDRAYSREEFLAHISTCEDAYELLVDP